MKNKDNRPKQAADLRRQAEEIAREKALQLSENLGTLSPEEQRQLLYELRVHQVELEMQNEALRRTQEELESSRVRYFNLYDLAPVGYFTLSEEGLILEANLTASSLLGVAGSALVKKSLTSFIFREDQDIYYHYRQQLFETGAPQVCVLRLVKKDGSLFWARLEETVAQDSESGDTCCRAVISDITERKQAEDALHKSEKNLAAIMNASTESIFLMDLEGGLLAANESLAQRLGTDLETLLRSNFYEFLPPDVAKNRKLHVEQVIKSGKPLYFEDERFERTILNSLYPIFDSKGQIIRLAVIGTDITERKKIEERERHFKQVLLAIRKVNQLIVQETDPERLIDQACQILTETLGYYNAWIALLDEGGKVTSTAASGFDDGFTIFEEHLKQGKYPLCIKKAFQEKGTIVIDSALDSCPDCPLYSGHVGRAGLSGRIQHGDKLYGMLSVSIPREYANLKETLKLFIELAGDLGLAFYKIDLEKEHKHMEMELIHSERMAIAGQLAAGVAHEFNNLLSIIGGSAEYAKGIRNDNEIKKSLDVIVKSVNRGAQVVKKLLTFTKRIELKKESVDLIEVIEEVVGLVKRDLENNLITVVRNYSDIPKTLIDVGQMQQVFLNLIINAKNAMSKGGKLAIKVEKEGKFIKIQFHNTGKTINKEDLPRLFTPFFATSLRQKKGMPGTGLGLAVSYGIIKAHNGVIKAESVKGKGTTFTILFSVTENENMAEVLPKAVAKAGKNNKRKLKQAEILIVDDEVEIRKLFKKVLDKEGYSVTVADSGGNALNLCRKKKFDLIYLDIIMPGMDGISVFKKIKGISPKTKIVFFTGKLIEDKVAGMYLDEGAAGFLRKPIPLKDLVSYTQNILKAKNE